jgi:ribosomal protein L29
MKYKELITQTDEQLKKELAQVQGEARDLQLKVKLGEVKNRHKLVALKKDIARMLTCLHARRES